MEEFFINYKCITPDLKKLKKNPSVNNLGFL